MERFNDEWHPTQILADFLTMLEHGNGKSLQEMKLCFVGDGRNNVASSLLVGSAKMGVDSGLRLQQVSYLIPGGSPGARFSLKNQVLALL